MNSRLISIIRKEFVQIDQYGATPRQFFNEYVGRGRIPHLRFAK